MAKISRKCRKVRMFGNDCNELKLNQLGSQVQITFWGIAPAFISEYFNILSAVYKGEV
jgi:hypothetical protein